MRKIYMWYIWILEYLIFLKPGQLQSTIECSVCRRSSNCFDPFLDLSLPLPREHGFKFRASNKWQLDIQDCLALFVAPEILNGNDKYKCATCKVNLIKPLHFYNIFPSCQGLQFNILRSLQQKSNIHSEHVPSKMLAIMNHIVLYVFYVIIINKQT